MGRVGMEPFADCAEAGFDVFIEHAVAQQLIVPYLKQLYVRLKIAVGCEDNGCLPIHQSHFGVGIPDAWTQDILNVVLVKGLTLGSYETRQGGGILIHEVIRTRIDRTQEKHRILFKHTAHLILGWHEFFLQGFLNSRPRPQAERIVENIVTFNNLYAFVITLL